MQVLYILTLGTLPGYRRRGLAQVLLQRCVHFCSPFNPTRHAHAEIHVHVWIVFRLDGANDGDVLMLYVQVHGGGDHPHPRRGKHHWIQIVE